MTLMTEDDKGCLGRLGMTVMTRDDWGLQGITRDECVD